MIRKRINMIEEKQEADLKYKRPSVPSEQDRKMKTPGSVTEDDQNE